MHPCPKSSPRAVLLRGGPDQAGLGAPVNYRAQMGFCVALQRNRYSTPFRASLEQTQHPPPSMRQNRSPPRRARTIGDGGCLPGGTSLGPAPAPPPLLHLVVRSENAPHTLRKYTCLYFCIKLGASNFLRTAVTRRRDHPAGPGQISLHRRRLEYHSFFKIAQILSSWRREIFQAPLPKTR